MRGAAIGGVIDRSGKLKMVPTPIYGAVALGLFRSSVFFFVAVAAFAQREDRTGTILTTLVFLIDVATYHVLQVLIVTTEGVYTRVWKDTLTNRFFYECLFEKIRDREHVDVDALFKEARVRSTEDIKTYLNDTTFWFGWGGFKKTLMGVWSFTWLWISYALFYGAAGWIGEGLLKH
jgi:hypothetical protein